MADEDTQYLEMEDKEAQPENQQGADKVNKKGAGQSLGNDANAGDADAPSTAGSDTVSDGGGLSDGGGSTGDAGGASQFGGSGN